MIRLATEADGQAVATIYAPFCEHDVVSFETSAPTADEMASRIRTISAQLPWLAFEDAGRVVGYAYATKHRERAAYGWAVDSAIYIGDGARGRGVGKALYSCLFDLLRLQGYFKVCAGITLPNPASIALHESAGFTRVGIYQGIGYKMGAWRDVVWYEMALQPERPEPPRPTPMPEVAHTPAWQKVLSEVR